MKRSAQLAADGIAKNFSTTTTTTATAGARLGIARLPPIEPLSRRGAQFIGVEMVDFVSEIRRRARVFLGHCIWEANPELCSNFRFNCRVSRFGSIGVYNLVYNEFWRHGHKISWSFQEAINLKCKIVAHTIGRGRTKG
jgi:hypothetical protein